MYICPKCKGNTIQQKAWVEINEPTNIEWVDSDSDEDFYCPDCNENIRAIEDDTSINQG